MSMVDRSLSDAACRWRAAGAALGNGPADIEFADGDPQIRLDPDTGIEDLPGWIWTVYPSNSSEPMVALGHSGNEARARGRVEESLAQAGAWGVVIGPRGEHMMCRRNSTGGFAWQPMFTDRE